MSQSKKVSFTCSECEFAQLLCVLLNDNVDDSGLKNLSEIAEFTSKAFCLSLQPTHLTLWTAANQVDKLQ